MPGKKLKKSPNKPQEDRLITVCRLLNKAKAKYVVIGAMACNLHGVIRATKDIDIFIPKDIKNTERVLRGLSHLPLKLAAELDAKEVVQKPITIVGDIPRVDLLTVTAGGVTFGKVHPSAKKVRIERVLIPFADIKTLLKTKDTDRLQDQADAERLRSIIK